MSAPQNKAELLQQMAAGRQEWETILALISETDMRQPGVEGNWSVKDIVAHICGLEQYMAAMLSDMKQPQGNETAMLDSYYQTNLTMYRAEHPDLPEQLQEIKGDQINQVFVAAFRYKRPSEVLSLESTAYQKILYGIDLFSDEELSKPFTPSGATLLQVLARQGYEHPLEHLTTIRTWLDHKDK